MIFSFSAHSIWSETVWARRAAQNLRTLQQNCASPVHNLIFGAGSITDHHLLQDLHFEHELLWGMCIFAQIIFSCSNSQPLHTPNWAGFWTSIRVSLFQEAIQAQVLNHPVCYWCCSWRNWFPACQIQPHKPHSLCQKSDTEWHLWNLVFFKNRFNLGKSSRYFTTSFVLDEMWFLIAILTKDTW